MTATGLPGASRTPRPWRRHPWLASVLALGALTAVAALVTAVFWPGHMDPDTLGEIDEARTGHLTDWHTPILSALWRVPYRLGLHSAGWILAVGVLSLLVGLYLVLRVLLPRPLAVAGAVACTLYGPVLGWAVHVGRDAWFTAFLLCAFGLAARALRVAGRERAVTLVAAVVFAFLAQAARQNGLPVVFTALVAVAAVALAGRWAGWRRAAGVLGVGALATLLLVGVQSGIQRYVLRVQATHPEQVLYIYDLATLSVREHRVLLPRQVFATQSLDYLDRWYTSSRNVNLLLFGADAEVRPFPVAGARFDALRTAWGDAVRSDPGGYLAEQWHVEVENLAVDAPAVWVFQFPPQPRGSGLTPRFARAYADARDYLLWFTDGGNNAFGGPLHAVWVYLLLVVAATAWLLRRGGALLVTGLLGAGVVLFSVALFFVASAPSYRYMYPAVVAACALLLVCVADAAGMVRSRVRGRSGATAAAPADRVQPQPVGAVPGVTGGPGADGDAREAASAGGDAVGSGR